MSLENPYAYSGTKRSRQELPPSDRLATPVAFTGGEWRPLHGRRGPPALC